MSSDDDFLPLPREPSRESHDRDPLAGALSQVRHALRNLRYGTVTIIVQDGVIVQIDRTEKTRLR